MRTDETWVADSIDELLEGATDRTPVRTGDAKSGATFERLRIDGEPHFLKVLSPESDWIMRCTRNTTHFELQAWRAGLYAAAPAEIDHAMVGMALEHDDAGSRLAMLMHDRAADLVPEGDAPLPVAQHAAFIGHLAAFHAAYLGWTDTIGLEDMGQRFLFFSTENVAAELAIAAGRRRSARPDRGGRRGMGSPRRAGPGVGRPHPLRARRPWPGGDRPLADAPHVRRRRLEDRQPRPHPDGTHVLLDWAYPGEAPGLLGPALVSRAEPEPDAGVQGGDDRAPTALRSRRGRGHVRLVRAAARPVPPRDHGTFGWEKAVGDEAELRWWEAAALAGASWLT